LFGHRFLPLRSNDPLPDSSATEISAFSLKRRDGADDLGLGVTVKRETQERARRAG
jgi:hypothetical protein